MLGSGCLLCFLLVLVTLVPCSHYCSVCAFSLLVNHVGGNVARWKIDLSLCVKCCIMSLELLSLFINPTVFIHQ